MPALARPPARPDSGSGRRRRRVLFAAAALAGAVLLLVVRHEPPQLGRRLFGGWRAGDVALAAVLVYVGGLLLLSCASRLAAQRLLLVTFATAIAWLGAEVVHVAVHDPDAPAAALGRRRQPNADVHGETPPDIAWAWGLPCEPVRFHFTTNAAGHRNPRDRDRGQVYCLGDSCLVGALLPWPDTVVARLEQALRVPCVNVALIGLAPQEAQAEFRALTPAPDLTDRLVLQFLCEDNDLLDSHGLAAAAAADGASAAPAPALWRRTLTERTILALQTWTQPVVAEAERRTGRFADHEVRFLWRHERGGAAERQVDVILAALESFGAEVAARGGTFGVVLIPAKLRALAPHCTFPADTDLGPDERAHWPLAERLAAWSHRSGIPSLDLHDALSAAAAAGRLTWFADDTHWNAAGAEVAAAAVAAWPVVRDHDAVRAR
jgi:hypothetical protein